MTEQQASSSKNVFQHTTENNRKLWAGYRRRNWNNANYKCKWQKQLLVRKFHL